MLVKCTDLLNETFMRKYSVVHTSEKVNWSDPTGNFQASFRDTGELYWNSNEFEENQWLRSFSDQTGWARMEETHFKRFPNTIYCNLVLLCSLGCQKNDFQNWFEFPKAISWKRQQEGTSEVSIAFNFKSLAQTTGLGNLHRPKRFQCTIAKLLWKLCVWEQNRCSARRNLPRGNLISLSHEKYGRFRRVEGRVTYRHYSRT